MKTTENDIRDALKELQKEAEESGGRGACPGEELLALYLDGGLAGREKDRVQEHLSLCPQCLEAVLLETSFAVESSVRELPERRWQEANQRAKDLVKPGLDKLLFDLVVRCYHGGMEVIRSSLTPLQPAFQPAAAVLRGDRQASGPEPLRMEKSFDHMAAELEIFASKEGVWTLQVLLKRKEEGPLPETLRISLKDLSVGKELCSTPARGGLAVFQEMPKGDYEVEIKERGSVVGKISVRLT